MGIAIGVDGVVVGGDEVVEEVVSGAVGGILKVGVEPVWGVVVAEAGGTCGGGCRHVEMGLVVAVGNREVHGAGAEGGEGGGA